MREAEYQRQETSVGYDGELVNEIFCTSCGSVNNPSADVCSSCHAILTEQGNHLSARLRRISRRGSTAEYRADESNEVLGNDWVEDAELSEPAISKLGTWVMMIGLGNWPIPVGVLLLLGVAVTVAVILLKSF
jgi:hypothetical protein